MQPQAKNPITKMKQDSKTQLRRKYTIWFLYVLVALTLIGIGVLIATSVLIAHHTIIPTPVPMAFVLLMCVAAPQIIWLYLHFKLYDKVSIRVLAVLNLLAFSGFLVLNMIYSSGIDFFGLSAIASVPMGIMGFILILALLILSLVARGVEMSVKLTGVVMALSFTFLYMQSLQIIVEMNRIFADVRASNEHIVDSDYYTTPAPDEKNSTQSSVPVTKLTPEQQLDKARWEKITHNYSSLQTDIAPRVKDCTITQIILKTVPTIPSGNYILLWERSTGDEKYLPISGMQALHDLYLQAISDNACGEKTSLDMMVWKDERLSTVH